MNCYIIYEKYYDFDNQRVLSGGIQTYLRNLIPIIQSFGFRCYLYQMGPEDNQIQLENVMVHAVKTDFSKDYRYNSRKLLQRFEDRFDNDKDLLLFATDMLICKNKAKRSLAIQHGICWDIPTHTNFSPSLNSIYAFSKVRSAYQIIRHLNYVSKVVCVDHNFPNWYRATCAYEAVPLDVIPNFTQVAEPFDKPADRINIMFARRFEWYRGTRVFAQSIDKLLQEYPQISVTVAGRGPDEDYLHKTLSKWNERVTFTQYTAEQSLAFHADKHIAVVPTVGSEGTSLSLLEAMSAQCAVVCTNVGGMTNIVLDGYNGLMVRAGSADGLYEAMKTLVENEQLRKYISQNGYETVKKVFSHDRWVAAWEKTLKEMGLDASV